MSTYTRDQVQQAANDAAELIICDGRLGVGDRETNLINLVVNTAVTLLEKPGTSLDEVMDTCYDGGSAQVRSWCGGWS